ncbi:MAG TPA: Gfo/Idh/MocA family oxidoreductase [bacterium]|nr:Gfo/Idh/MocA family oxidoreductase [bacterium]HOL93517.1 Gfo/Idh/MocA family oxidoreductase [bacterium]HPO99529.1 Gfo/Idh/MocA family oxidoreductase [bacterium]HXK94387.1 Gfo/Idh/MocA family oxidoreductase [bacterium]
MMNTQITRRGFLIGSAAALTAGCATSKVRRVPIVQSRRVSPNETLNIAGIGVGGKGYSDVETCDSENIVALCDVDWNSAAGAFNRFPKAKKFKDFRKMLDECPEIDAVTISTPDHTHAIAALRCMERGKAVYVQKPLTHKVNEARILREAAHRYGVATQMGNQGAATDMHREVCEWIWAGLIGTVREVHSWTDRPKGWWPQGIPGPLAEEQVPEHLDWDLWLGPAPFRPYNSGYCPFRWRGWWDFGTGALGDIACHNLSPVAKALRLEYPISVECLHVKDANDQTFPTESILHYRFPARGNFAALDLYWYDGLLKPKRLEEIRNAGELVKEKTGNLFVGDQGMILMSGRNERNFLIVGGEIVEDFPKPDPIIPRLPNLRTPEGKQDADRMHKLDWILSIKTGSESGTNFDHAGPLAEWVVMGNISLKFPKQRLDWDGPAMRFTNNKEANAYVTKEYRKGWELV